MLINLCHWATIGFTEAAEFLPILSAKLAFPPIGEMLLQIDPLLISEAIEEGRGSLQRRTFLGLSLQAIEQSIFALPRWLVLPVLPTLAMPQLFSLDAPAIEISLGNSSFAMLLLAMLFYWTETAFYERKKNYTYQPSPLSPSIVASGVEVERKGKIEGGTVCMGIANLLLVILLVLRWQDSGHFPLSNLYESLMFLCWSCTLIQFLILNLLKPKDFLMAKLIGSITSPCALLTNAYASFCLPKDMQNASPLVPALQSNWLMMHVTVMILSYAALIVGSLLAIAFLLLSKRLETKELSTNRPPSNQKLANNLDNLSYRILGVGFPLLTIGILSGAVWANEAWGSYWSWDPKETWALLTWLVFAIYLHTRLTKGWEGRKPAIIASFGFITVWVCFLGVNLLGEGLHSYGWLSN